MPRMIQRPRAARATARIPRRPRAGRCRPARAARSLLCLSDTRHPALHPFRRFGPGTRRSYIADQMGQEITYEAGDAAYAYRISLADWQLIQSLREHLPLEIEALFIVPALG